MGGHWRVTTHGIHNRLIDETVLIACVAGSGWLKIQERRFNIKAGDIFCCPPSLSHGYRCGEEGWEIYWTHCQGRQVTTLCEAAGLNAVTPVRPLAHYPQVREAFAVLVDGLAIGGNESPWLAARNLHTLLHALVWHHCKPAKGQSLADLVKEGCESLDELVAASGYSRFHFCRLFKAETGQTPWQYVLDRRLGRARELLLGSHLSIKEIASKLGFNNPDYFSRIFSRNSGVTPKCYRGRHIILPPPSHRAKSLLQG